MRPTCLSCAGKHIAQACVLMKETKTGYPMFRWFVIGHLAEAEEETVMAHPEFAGEIREYRVAYAADQDIIIPFEVLLSRIDELLADDESSAEDDPGETKSIERSLVDEAASHNEVVELKRPTRPPGRLYRDGQLVGEGDLETTP